MLGGSEVESDRVAISWVAYSQILSTDVSREICPTVQYPLGTVVA